MYEKFNKRENFYYSYFRTVGRLTNGREQQYKSISSLFTRFSTGESIFQVYPFVKESLLFTFIHLRFDAI